MSSKVRRIERDVDEDEDEQVKEKKDFHKSGARFSTEIYT
jgi:hypothetical protein